MASPGKIICVRGARNNYMAPRAHPANWNNNELRNCCMGPPVVPLRAPCRPWSTSACPRSARFRAGTKFNNLIENSRLFFVGVGVFFCSEMCCPRRARKRTSKNIENPKIFGFHRLYNGFTHFHMQIRCKKQPRCISTRPRPVLKGPGAGK